MMARHATKFRPSFDRLEDRWTPAGNVTASLSFGTLTVTGDLFANNVDLSQTGFKQYQITGNATTVTATGVVNAAGTPVTFNNVTNVIFRMNGGDDTVTFGNQTAGAITILGGLRIEGGVGNNQILTPGGAVSLTVIGGFTIVNGAGNDVTNLINLNVGGAFKIDHSAGGGSDTEITNDVGAGTFNSLGSVSVTNGSGADTTFFEDTNVSGNVVVNSGSGDIATGAAGDTDFFNVTNTGAVAVVGGSVSFTNTSGDGQQFFDDVQINGNATMNLGSGAMNAGIGPFNQTNITLIKGNLGITGSGTATLTLGNGQTGATFGMQVNGNLSINLSGSGVQTINFTDVVVGRATTVITGSGADNIVIDDGNSATGSTFGGSFAMNTGGGTDSVTINGSGVTTTFNGPTAVNLGNGNDTLNFGNNGTVALFSSAVFDGGSVNGVRFNDFNTLQNGGNFTFVTTPVFRNFP
jgi:hypothetical protein